MGLDVEALKKFQSTVMDSLPGKYTITTDGRLTAAVAAGQSFDGIFEGGRNGPRLNERLQACQNTSSSQLVVIVMAAAGTNVVSVPHQSGAAAAVAAAHSLCLINPDCRFSRHYSRTANI